MAMCSTVICICCTNLMGRKLHHQKCSKMTITKPSKRVISVCCCHSRKPPLNYRVNDPQVKNSIGTALHA